MAQVKTTIQVPKHLKPEQRQVLAEEVVDYIIDRSAMGMDKNNRKFKRYTDAYADRKGVDTDEVDLVLSGEMLEALTVLGHKSGAITIGYEKDDPMAGRAEGNILGSYGRDPNPKKARDFLGIAKKDLYTLLKDEYYDPI